MEFNARLFDAIFHVIVACNQSLLKIYNQPLLIISGLNFNSHLERLEILRVIKYQYNLYYINYFESQNKEANRCWTFRYVFQELRTKVENDDEFGALRSDLQTHEDLLTSSQLENRLITGFYLRPAGRVSGHKAPGRFLNLQENQQKKVK